MKITFVLPYAGLAGGIRVVAIYAQKLKQRGHDVTVVSIPKRPVSIKEKIKGYLKNKKWPSHTNGQSHFDGVDVEHKVLEKYRPITNDDVPDADVVIATWWETAEWVNDFNSSKGEKFYFVQHHEIHRRLPIDRVKATYLLPLRKIVVSQWLKDIMSNEYRDKNVALVPNGVDFDFFNAPARGRQPVPTVGFMYSPSHFKGCDIIIAALKKVQKTIPKLRVVAFGATLPSLNLPIHPETEYFCCPSQQEIVEIYSSCDFWLFGSRVEGFGLPILEAMACRTPVIATKAGAAPELVGQTDAGIMVGDCNAEVVADVVLRGLDLTEEQWVTMSLRARQTVENYSWDDATDLFVEAIKARNG